MERVNAYIDGYNLYHSLKDQGWKWAYWLNVQALAQNMLTPNQRLEFTKYFTTRVTQPEDKRRRQQTFLEALDTLSDYKPYYGKYVPDEVECWKCGHTYTTYHEKMTDVNIAVEMMADALKNRFDTAILISGDSDLVGLVRKVRNLFGKRVVVAFPPERKPRSLRKEASAIIDIGASLLSKSLFPEKIIKPNGYTLRRPVEWM